MKMPKCIIKQFAYFSTPTEGDDELKIGYYYRSILLGVLEKTENGFIYTSNIANEQYSVDKGILTFSEYGLWNSYKRESKTLFSDFVDLLKSCSRIDILETAKISSTDSRWEILAKLSRLEWGTSSFYVGQIL